VRKVISLSACLVFVASVASHAVAQESRAADVRPPTSGEILMEDTTPVKRNLRIAGLHEVSVWADALAQAASQSGEVSIASLKTEGVDYLTVLYLFCAKKLGACPFILESVLEADLMSAHRSASLQCETMSHFWKRWIDMDGDKRLEFSVSIGSASKLAEFNASGRQRFVQCKDTVSSVLAQKGALSSRYGAGTAAAKSAATLKALVHEIEQKHIDIFGACGL
jgi:hypothetical protein